MLCGLVACSATDPYKPERLAPCAACGVHAVVGIRSADNGSIRIASLPDGAIACSVYSEIWRIDAEGHPRDAIYFDDVPRTFTNFLATSADGSIYAERLTSRSPDMQDQIADLFAFGPTGHLRWSMPPAGGYLAASDEGPYEVRGTQLYGFDADGTMRWTKPLPTAILPYGWAPDGSGNVIVGSADATTTTIQKLDLHGNVMWSRALGDVSIDYLAAGPDGAFAVVGKAIGPSTNLGNVTLTGSGMYVAMFDSTGATRWATIIDPVDAADADDGLAVVGGDAIVARVQSQDGPASVARVNGTGIVDTIDLGSANAYSPVAAPDGTLWLLASGNVEIDGDPLAPEHPYDMVLFNVAL